MTTVAVTYTFAPATLIESSKANQNFQDLVSYINTNGIVKDATVAFTGTPSGPASDPVSDNQFTRKAYVDRGPKLVNNLHVPTGTRTTTSGTYVDWPAGEVHTISHTKRMAATEILVMHFGSAYQSAVGTSVEYAIKVDAGADNAMSQFFFNIANAHFPIHGMVRISGLSAAAHTYTLRAKTSAGTLTVDTQDFGRLLVMECN